MIGERDQLAGLVDARLEPVPAAGPVEIALDVVLAAQSSWIGVPGSCFAIAAAWTM